MADDDLEQKVGFDPYEPGRANLRGDRRPPMPVTIKLLIGFYLLLLASTALMAYFFPGAPGKQLPTHWRAINVAAMAIGCLGSIVLLILRLRASLVLGIIVVFFGGTLRIAFGQTLWPEGNAIFDFASQFVFSPAVLLIGWTPFALSRSALAFLGMLCPKCEHHKRGYAGFWLDNYRCKKCQTVWAARTWLWALKNRG